MRIEEERAEKPVRTEAEGAVKTKEGKSKEGVGRLLEIGQLETIRIKEAQKKTRLLMNQSCEDVVRMQLKDKVR